MKKIVSILIIAVFILTQINVYAASDVRDYFILDKGYDIGKVQTGNGWFYTPGIPYDDTDKVKELFDKNFWYEKDFYEGHGFKKEFIDGRDTDSIFFVNWDTPVVLDNINDVRKLTGRLEYSYKKDGKIQWQDGATMPNNFVPGYGKQGNQLVILYPVKDKTTGYTEAFVQYPCGNLVCKDDKCSSLKKENKQVSCSANVNAGKVFEGDKITLDITKSDKNLDVQTVQVNGKTVVSDVKSNKVNLSGLKQGTYSVTVTGKNLYNTSNVSCETSFTVERKVECGDAIKEAGEQCDDGNNINGDGCSKTCELEKPSCEISSKSICLPSGSNIAEGFNISKDGGELNSIRVDGKKVDKFYKFNTGGIHNVALTYANIYDSGVQYTCEANIKVRSNPFCGDGIVNNGEVCDPNDARTGTMCTDTCQGKMPQRCSIEIAGDLVKDKTMFIGIDKDYYSKIVDVKMDNESIRVYGDYSGYKLTSAGNSVVTVTLANKTDSTKTTTCRKEITVQGGEMCR